VADEFKFERVRFHHVVAPVFIDFGFAWFMFGFEVSVISEMNGEILRQFFKTCVSFLKRVFLVKKGKNWCVLGGFWKCCGELEQLRRWR
jgi:hypothetical protein